MRQRRDWFDLNDPRLERPRVAVLGFPFDSAVSRKRGAAAAPGHLRALSRASDAIDRRGRPVSVALRDFGDVPVEDATDSGALEQAAAGALAAIPAGAFLIALGGDNSISVPVLRWFARRHGPAAGVIWFDAHPDLFDTYDGSPHSHACALRRALDLTGIPARNVVLAGTRSFSHEELSFVRGEGMEMISAADWEEHGADGAVERAARRLASSPAVYLAVDVDGLDAACAPGTGYPLPGGVPAGSFFRFMEGVFRRLPIRALDLTEIAPDLDHNDVTSFLGVQIVLESLAQVDAAG